MDDNIYAPQYRGGGVSTLVKELMAAYRVMQISFKEKSSQ